MKNAPPDSTSIRPDGLPETGSAPRRSANPLDHPPFDELDRHFARFVQRLAGAENPDLALAAALVSRTRTEGDVCLDLKRVAGNDYPAVSLGNSSSIRCPGLAEWRTALLQTSVVGRPGDFTPLILDDQDRLYLHRYWIYEQSLIAAISSRAGLQPVEVDGGRLRAGLNRLFPPGSATDWQRVAVFNAVQRKLCVISGGPGTGKTHTVVSLLALLLELHHPLRIALAAPTGKAAARLQESIRKARVGLACSEEIKAQLPEEASTLHRLLGTIPGSAFFRHDAANPLPVDVIVVDEASMVDLAMMAKLLDATPAKARVILVGDKDQLASVEAGGVLGDICRAGGPNGFSAQFVEAYQQATGDKLSPGTPSAGALSGGVVELQRNYRFGEASGIFALSKSVNDGDAAGAIEMLRRFGQSGSSVRWSETPARGNMKAALRESILAGYTEYLSIREPRAALERLGQFRILCTLREGPYGLVSLNLIAEEILEAEGLIQKTGSNYAGRPILITRNDYDLKLFNGDVGIILPDAQSRELRAFFLAEDKKVRSVSPLRLPDHETAFAMTVHKCQGSEFGTVLLILPDRENPVLTRELVYTGLTRASRSVELRANESVLRTAIERAVVRTSGLREALS